MLPGAAGYKLVPYIYIVHPNRDVVAGWVLQTADIKLPIISIKSIIHI